MQVNGKTRGTVDVPEGADQATVHAAAMADAGIAKFVTGEPKKIVFVAGRLLSIVV